MLLGMPFLDTKVQGYTMLQMVDNAGLSGIVKCCWDAGDRNSWSGSGNWVDVVTGYELGLGSQTGGDGVAPTFNGRVGGRSSNEYWSSPGGNAGFEMTTNNDTWWNSLHKPNYNWSYCVVEQWSGSYGAGPIVTRSGSISSGSSRGVSTGMIGSQYFRYIGNGTLSILGTAPSNIPSGQPNFYIGGLKYNSNTSRDGIHFLNGTWSTTHSSENWSASSSDASTRYKLGLTSNDSSFMAAGRRLYGFMMFTRLLSETEARNLYAQMKLRFPGLWT